MLEHQCPAAHAPHGTPQDTCALRRPRCAVVVVAAADVLSAQLCMRRAAPPSIMPWHGMAWRTAPRAGCRVWLAAWARGAPCQPHHRCCGCVALSAGHGRTLPTRPPPADQRALRGVMRPPRLEPRRQGSRRVLGTMAAVQALLMPVEHGWQLGPHSVVAPGMQAVAAALLAVAWPQPRPELHPSILPSFLCAQPNLPTVEATSCGMRAIPSAPQ